MKKTRLYLFASASLIAMAGTYASALRSPDLLSQLAYFPTVILVDDVPKFVCQETTAPDVCTTSSVSGVRCKITGSTVIDAYKTNPNANCGAPLYYPALP